MPAVGLAPMRGAQVLFLDGPSIGLAPNLVERVMASVREIDRSFGT